MAEAAVASSSDLAAPQGAPESHAPGFDISTLIGIVVAFGLIITAMALGGGLQSFADAPAALIVLGGTAAVVMACYSLPEVLRAGGVIARTVVYITRDPRDIMKTLMRYAVQARKGGVLTIQEMVQEETNPFLRKGLSMAVDGMPAADIEQILNQDVGAMVERHHKSIAILRKAAEVSPAMGLIGTLVGLVQMLSGLDDPSSIGPAMAVALLTTLYGAILAYMLFIPLASKLERNSRAEVRVQSLCVKGIISIAGQENPRKLEVLLNAQLPPSQRVKFFES